MSVIPNVEGLPFPAQDPGNDPGPEGKLPAGKKPSKAIHKTGPPPSRFSLRMSANWWRSLQYIGMTMHFLAPPRPPSPAFTKTFTTTLSSRKGSITLHFYTPENYRKSKDTTDRYPAVVNFHGGGFTLGGPLDDARFARFVVDNCNALFVSVDYRLAPEHPFPTAVEDGADALLYLIQNAAKLRIDPFKLATSGFSAGGNIAITSTLCLAKHLKSHSKSVPDHRIAAIATWYPVTDYTITRAERRATSVRPDQTLPATLTDLFDASYLYPPSLNLADPYLSPAKASDEELAEGIPSNVLFYTCEWDMLLREGEDFAKRLANKPLDKKVYYKMILGVPHGWDKGPNPVKPPAMSEELYKECTEKLKAIFDSE